MFRVKVGDQLVEIPGHLIAEAVTQMLPAWLVGKAPPPNMKAGAVKSGIRALIPSLFALMHVDSVAKGLGIPAPDLKSKAAKQNIIGYAIAYLLGNATTLADDYVFTVEGEEHAGTIIVSGLSTSPTHVEPETAGTDHLRIASPIV